MPAAGRKDRVSHTSLQIASAQHSRMAAGNEKEQAPNTCIFEA